MIMKHAKILKMKFHFIEKIVYSQEDLYTE